ncbi:polyprenyl synthetase family protein [Mycobacterium sp. 155]|uniref:polyprenyl synthetase family protein n=1 Tax=Mycobacterium sp. 155 TaxID=1157943 RepID=UPI0003AAB6FF|nr:polyprenyl synthetase family protein [Mycobacterium sp. 155]
MPASACGELHRQSAYPLPSTRDLVAAIDSQLSAHLDVRRRDAVYLGSDYEALIVALVRFVLVGGKRLRPMFAYWGWRAVLPENSRPSPTEVEDLLLLFSALELLQGCALLHDDVIDRSEQRRGNATAHIAFANLHRANGWSGSAEQFGLSAAILMGDLSLTWADDIVASAPISRDAHQRVQNVWSKLRTEILGGQFLDIVAECSNNESIVAAMKVNMYKTAAYTVARPLQLGAAAAADRPDCQKVFHSIGMAFGIAFQLHDDILDLFGDPALTGKARGQDLRCGKRTVLLAEAIARADSSVPKAANHLRGILGSNLSEAEVADCAALIETLGARAAVEERINSLVQQGLHELDAAPVDPAARAGLRQLAANLCTPILAAPTRPIDPTIS